MTNGYEIHNIDGDHTNNTQENLVPACELCHSPFHLDIVSRKWPSDPGKIIFLPEMTQTELNNLLQAIFYSMAMQRMNPSVAPEQLSDIQDQSLLNGHTVYFNLIKRAELVERNGAGEVVRPQLSSPLVMARVLSDMDDETYARRDVLLSGCRYLPPMDYFLDQAAKWGDHGASFSRLDLDAWRSVAGMTGKA
jgi:intracellular multiplication protein IcmJ